MSRDGRLFLADMHASAAKVVRYTAGMNAQAFQAVVTSKVPALLGELQRYGSAPEA